MKSMYLFASLAMICGAACGEGSSTSVCGDGEKQADEDCDSSDVGSRTCQELGFTGGQLGCTAECVYDLSGCVDTCGNGIVEAPEECDGTDLAATTCDGLGLEPGALGCSADCTFDTSGCNNSCGNGTTDGNEACDGDDLGAEDCTTQGFVGGQLQCLPNCSGFDSSNCCGDGTVGPSEPCDDGNAVDWDGCNDCVVSEFGVNTNKDADQRQPRMAMAADGRFVVVWQSDGQDGSGSGIYGQVFDSTGMPVGQEFRVNQSTDGDQDMPAVAMNDNGRIMVVWQSFISSVGEYRVFARAFDDYGSPHLDELSISSGWGDYDHVSPSVAIGGDGRFVVTWYDDSPTSPDLWSRSGDAQGNLNAGSRQISWNAISGGVSIAMANDGRYIVAYVESESGSQWVYVERSDATGTPIWPDIQVGTTCGSFQANPAAAIKNDGQFVVTWECRTNQSSTDNDVWVQRFDAAGTPLEIESRVNSHTAEDQVNSAVAIAENGGFVVSWESMNQDGGAEGIFLQHFDALGAPNGPETPVNLFTASMQLLPNVGISTDGRTAVVWESALIDGSGFGIFAQRYTANGVAVGTVPW